MAQAKSQSTICGHGCGQNCGHFARCPHCVVLDLAVEGRIPTVSDCRSKTLSEVLAVASQIALVQVLETRAPGYLKWLSPELSGSSSNLALRDNYFRHPATNPAVLIRVGSIHAAKGETHTATLVSETYSRNHHLAALKPWLLGKKSGGGNANATMISRLRQHYVAMTHPTHLLCMAMKSSDLSDE